MQKITDATFVTLYSRHAPAVELAEAQTRVFAHFGIPHTAVVVDTWTYGKTEALHDELIRDCQTYRMFMEIDALPLRPDLGNLIRQKIDDGRTLFGVAQQSNHIRVNGTAIHAYAGPACLGITKQLYTDLGEPSFIPNARGDTAEEVTWRAEERGRTVALVYPADSDGAWPLHNGMRFGHGVTYDNLCYHAFGALHNPASRAAYLRKCEEVLGTSL